MPSLQDDVLRAPSHACVSSHSSQCPLCLSPSLRPPPSLLCQGNRTTLPVVSSLPAGLVDDLKWLLRTAYDKHGLAVCVSLWSHDILSVRRWNSVANRARAMHMMSNDNATAAYVDNALLPMIAALREPMRPGGPTYLDAVISWDGE